MSDIVIYGLGGMMLFQAYVTIRVVRSKAFTPQQKWRQSLFIWLVPFVGAAATLAVLATEPETPARPDTDAAPQKPKNRD
jgi:tellurite resistance protein TehA-like permease